MQNHGSNQIKKKLKKKKKINRQRRQARNTTETLLKAGIFPRTRMGIVRLNMKEMVLTQLGEREA